MTPLDILTLIQNDPHIMHILSCAEHINLPDWAIGTGFVRNKVWDHLHNRTENTPPTDIDLIYFDAHNIHSEKDIEARLKKCAPNVTWEPVNQATSHGWNNETPHTSTADAMSKWPETATAVGVKIENGTLHLIAPLGIDDLVGMIVRPTPAFSVSESKLQRVRDRVTQKRWKEKWPKLTILV